MLSASLRQSSSITADGRIVILIVAVDVASSEQRGTKPNTHKKNSNTLSWPAGEERQGIDPVENTSTVDRDMRLRLVRHPTIFFMK